MITNTENIFITELPRENRVNRIRQELLKGKEKPLTLEELKTVNENTDITKAEELAKTNPALLIKSIQALPKNQTSAFLLAKSRANSENMLVRILKRNANSIECFAPLAFRLIQTLPGIKLTPEDEVLFTEHAIARLTSNQSLNMLNDLDSFLDKTNSTTCNQFSAQAQAFLDDNFIQFLQTHPSAAQYVFRDSSIARNIPATPDTLNLAMKELSTLHDALQQRSNNGFTQGEPAQNELTLEESAQDEPVQEESAQDEFTLEESAQDEPVQEESAQDEFTLEESTQDEPVQDELTQDEPAQDEPTQDKPVQDKSAQGKPVQDCFIPTTTCFAWIADLDQKRIALNTKVNQFGCTNTPDKNSQKLFMGLALVRTSCPTYC